MLLYALNSVSVQEKLSHSVNSFAQTGNLSCHVVLVVNALRSSHLDGLGSSGQFSLCSFLVAGLNCGVYLLDSGLNAGTDSFVSVSSCAGY